MVERIPACVDCVYRIDLPVCDAYPDGGIPQDILDGLDHHLTPRAGDNGLQFKPYPGLEKEGSRTPVPTAQELADLEAQARVDPEG